jgi:hypothetical protein
MALSEITVTEDRHACARRVAGHVALIRPRTSCLPDLLFACDIRLLGSATVLNADELSVRLAKGELWSEAWGEPRG